MKLLDREQVQDKEHKLEHERTVDERFEEITRQIEPKREVAQPVVTKRRFTRKPLFGLALIVAAIAAVAIAFVATRGDDTVTEPVPATEPATAAPVVVESNWPFTEEEIDLMQLARAGYIPREAVDWELMELKGLVLRGVIPAETLERPLPPVRSLHTQEELALLELVRTNQIPPQAIDVQRMELIDLVARGHVPAESLVTPTRPLLVAAQRNPAIAANSELLELYRANQIPREAVDWQLLELVDLVNVRHAPIESLYITP
jgi:hypothetical protein